MSTSAEDPGGSRLATYRVENLGDGIFAIAMTLLILEFHVPQLGGPSVSRALAQALIEMWPVLICYAMSFLILGVLWIGHHNQFHFIRRTDRLMLWINLAFLMSIAFIPFSTGLLGRYPAERLTIEVYGTNLALSGLTLYGHWRYAVRRGLTDRLDDYVDKTTGRRVLWGSAAYIVGMVIGLALPRWALFVFAAIPFIYIPGGRIDRYCIAGGR